MGDRPQHVDPDDGALRRARALAAPSRLRILSLLRAAEAPLAAGDLATEMGVHHTAVRQHLEVLLAAGLVVATPLPVIGRGRPRTGYLATAVTDGGPYRELAGMLADAVRTGRDARTIGREFGRRVPQLSEGPLATLRAETERMGFEPELRGRGAVHELRLRACPFAELAVDDPGTVCQLHLGLAEGIVECGSPLTVEGIVLADPHRGGCRIVMRTAPAT